MKSDIELRVAGQTLKIRTDEDEAYMKRLAKYVDEHMAEVSSGRKGTTTVSVALLAALKIADAYHKLEGAHGSVDATLDRLSETIEAALDKSGG